MYQSDLKDEEWALLEGYFKPSDPRGRKAKHDKKAIVNAILYVVKSGCQWRMIPKDLPPWKTVYGHFSHWNKTGAWESALDKLNSQYHLSQKKELRQAMELLTHKASKPSTPARTEGSMAVKK
ncbi:transposase [Glaciimonas sp. GG7]